jgi:hypothetical protein
MGRVIYEFDHTGYAVLDRARAYLGVILQFVVLDLSGRCTDRYTKIVRVELDANGVSSRSNLNLFYHFVHESVPESECAVLTPADNVFLIW